MIKTINEFDIFKLSNFDDVVVDYRTVPETDVPYVVVDNFYNDIEKVKDLANSLPYTESSYICNSSPGKRVRMELDIRDIQKVALGFLKIPKWLAIDIEPRVIFNKMRSNNLLKPEQTNPHIDAPKGYTAGFNCAMVLYLNTPEECKGGTGFYKHKGTGLIQVRNKYEATVVHKYFNGKAINFGRFMNESNEEWELIDLIEMKSNRALIYPSNVFHSPYITEGDFTEYDRFTQLGFF